MNTYLKHIRLNGFNRQTRDIELKPGLNTIIGPNGSGKTTLWQAVEFATTGAITGYPKRAYALMKRIASGLQCSASILFSDDTTASRQLTRKGTTASSKVLSPSVSAIAPTCLSIAGFLEATAKERAGMILAASGADVERIVNKALLDSGLKGFIRPSGIHEFEGFGEWLEGINRDTAEALSTLRHAADTMKGTIRGAAVLDEDAAGDCSSQIETIQGELKAIQRDWHQHETLCGQLLARKGEAQRALDDYGNPSPVAPLAHSAAQISAKIQPARETYDHDFDLVRKQRSRIESYDRLLSEHQSLVASASSAEEELSGYDCRDIATITAEIESVRDLKGAAFSRYKDLEQGLKDDTCPHCGADHQHWTRVQRHDSAAYEQALAAHRELTDRFNELTEELAHANAKKAIADTIVSLTKKAQTTKALIDETYPDGVGPERAKLVELENNASRLKSEWENLNTSWQQAITAEAALEKAATAARIRERLDGIVLEISAAQSRTDKILADMQAKEAELTPLYEQASRQKASLEARALREQAEKRLADTEKQIETLKAAADSFMAQLNGQLSELLRPIIEATNVFGEQLFDSDLTVENLEIGYWRGPDYISIDAMSKSNRTIALVALQVALASGTDGLKIVFIDEFSAIDDSRKAQVIRNLEHAINIGIVTQVLVCDNRPIPAPNAHLVNL